MRKNLFIAALAFLCLLPACAGPDRIETSARVASWPAVGSPLDSSVTDYRGPQIATLMIPGGHSAGAWLPDGSLWNGDTELAILLASGNSLPFQAKEIIEPGVFIYRSQAEVDGILFEAIALAPWLGGRADSMVWVCLELIAHNRGEAQRQYRLHAAVRSGGGKYHFFNPYASREARFSYQIKDDRVIRDGRLVGIYPEDFRPSSESNIENRGQLAMEKYGARTSMDLDLQPGESRRFRFWLAPVAGEVRPPAEDFRNLTLSDLIAKTRNSWHEESARGAVYRFPDQRFERVFAAARNLVISAFQIHGASRRPIGNPFQYRDLYLRDGVRIVRALNLLGRHELAGDALDQLYEFQWPPGAFLSQKGQLDGTGQALWALGQHAALSGDSAAVNPHLPAARRGAEWIKRMRAYSISRGGPTAGLLPFSDPRDNELILGHLLGSDCWALAGLESLAGLLEERGDVSSANPLRELSRDYRRTLERVWSREIRRQGRPLPPAVEPGARDWGNLTAVYPTGVLQPSDPRAIALDRWLRKTQYTAGLPTYGGRDSLHHYLGFDMTQAALRRGERDQVAADVRAYFEFCQPDGTGFEIIERMSREFAANLPPHGTFAAMLIDLARSQVVYEREDSFVLLAGVPHSWLAPGSIIEIIDGPTLWSAISLRVEATQDTLRIVARLPRKATVELPRELAVQSIQGPGDPIRLGPHRLELPAGDGEWVCVIGKRS